MYACHVCLVCLSYCSSSFLPFLLRRLLCLRDDTTAFYVRESWFGPFVSGLRCLRVLPLPFDDWSLCDEYWTQPSLCRGCRRHLPSVSFPRRDDRNGLPRLRLVWDITMRAWHAQERPVLQRACFSRTFQLHGSIKWKGSEIQYGKERTIRVEKIKTVSR